MVEQVFRDLDSGSEVEWRLPITAAGMDKLRIGGNQFLELFEHAQSRCRMHSDDGAALDGICGQFRLSAIEQPEAAGPPLAAGIDVRAGIEQYIEHGCAADLIYQRR